MFYDMLHRIISEEITQGSKTTSGRTTDNGKVALEGEDNEWE